MTMPGEAEIVQQLLELRKRELKRAVPDGNGTLPLETVQELITRAGAPQPINAVVKSSEPHFRELSDRQKQQNLDLNSGIMPGIGPEHRVVFELGDITREDVQYLRLVRAAKLERVANPKPAPMKRPKGEEIDPKLLDPAPSHGNGVKLSHTVPGYVTYVKSNEFTGDDWERAVLRPAEAGSRGQLLEALAQEFKLAQWSYDGPTEQWVANQPGAVNIDRPGVQQAPTSFPMLMWMEFLGVLFRPDGVEPRILNVRHYADSMIVLNDKKVSAIVDEEWNNAANLAR